MSFSLSSDMVGFFWGGGVGSGERGGKLYFLSGIKKPKNSSKISGPRPSAVSCLSLVAVREGGVQQEGISHAEKPCLLHLQKQLCLPAEKSSPTLRLCPSHFAEARRKTYFPRKRLEGSGQPYRRVPVHLSFPSPPKSKLACVLWRRGLSAPVNCPSPKPPAHPRLKDQNAAFLTHSRGREGSPVTCTLAAA